MKILLIGLTLILPSVTYAGNQNYMESSEYVEAMKGDIDSQYNIAMNFLNELDGFPKNNQKALYWFTQAADQNDPDAQNALGIMYLRGFGTSQDMEKAEYYYRLAAEQGQDNAELQLGLILLMKNDSKSEAIAWLEKSAAKGNDEAIAKLKSLKK